MLKLIKSSSSAVINFLLLTFTIKFVIVIMWGFVLFVCFVLFVAVEILPLLLLLLIIIIMMMMMIIIIIIIKDTFSAFQMHYFLHERVRKSQIISIRLQTFTDN